MADIDHLQEPMRTIVRKILSDHPSITVVSGFRTRAQQEALYRAYLNGTGNLAAKPGTSNHEHGMAVDFGGDLELLHRIAPRYGLHFPVRGENWHAELMPGFDFGSIGAGQPQDWDAWARQMGVQYDLAYHGLDELPQNPQDVLANRLNAVLSITGATEDDFLANGPGARMQPVEDPSMDVLEGPSTFPMEQGQELPEQRSRVDEFMNMVQMNPTVRYGTNQNMPQAPTHLAGDNSPTGLKGMVRQMMGQFGWNDDQWAALDLLVQKESSWRPNADNPTSTAYGLFQFLDSTWGAYGFQKTDDPHGQAVAGLTYIKRRYGTPQNALNFHLRNNWY